MSDTPENDSTTTPVRRRRAAAGRPAGAPNPVTETAAPAAADATETAAVAPAKKAPAKKAAAKKAPAKKTTKASKAAADAEVEASTLVEAVEATPEAVADPAADEPKAPAKRTRTRAIKATFSAAEEPASAPAPAAEAPTASTDAAEDAPAPRRRRRATTAVFLEAEVAEVDPDAEVDPEADPAADPEAEAVEGEQDAEAGAEGESADNADAADEDADGEESEDGAASGAPRRRRRRGGRGRNRGNRAQQGEGDADGEGESADGTPRAERAPRPERTEDGSGPAADGDDAAEGSTGTARRRKRRRAGEATDGEDSDGNVVVRVREPRADKDRNEVRGVQGSTRLEAKRQRRKDSRDAPRRRAPLLTEAEFLARRESVERVMLVRQEGEKTQIAVLENGVLAEHYVTRASTTSYAGNVYLGKVQNVLPSMEAAFVDIGKGRNAVLYAGEVNYDLSGLEGKPQRIEQVLTSGQELLVQVTKDPIGHKGARLTSQVSLPGRYLVYVPGGSTHGISRKLPDAERSRLKSILKKVVPDDAGVIVRTAAEGASEEDLQRDVERLAAQWADIEAKTKKAKAKAPTLLYSEPDLVLRVIRDIFNEDVKSVVVQGTTEADAIEEYVGWIAPDLSSRISRWAANEDNGDIFEAHRVDEQLQKALGTKVHLPSGGYLIIERTEAMTVIDVNTGKYVGKGGNLEETVTKNNLEAAEEVVRQLRLRDVGGIIVIDFVDMVLESNRDLVLRRLIESLGRDRTKHNVAEVTSLGLVQMTRKRVGQGLLEAYSTTCDHCGGKGHVLTSDAPDATTSTKKKGKGIPANMRPRTPVEDAIAADADKAAADAGDEEAVVNADEKDADNAIPEADLELLDTENSHNAGEDSADDEADEADDSSDDSDDADDDTVAEAETPADAEVEDSLNEAISSASD